MARTSHELDSWRDPPLFRLLSTAIPLHGNHLNKVWQGLVHREGVAEAGVPMIVKWLPDQIKLMTELACAMAAQALKLPVPSGGLVLCPSDQLPELPQGAGSGLLICFGSYLQFEDRGSAALMKNEDGAVAEFVWRQVCQSRTAGPGAAWDELVANGDRHCENLIFDGTKWWLFDHERALEPLSQVMRRFADQVVRQQVISHRAVRNNLAQELVARRPRDHRLDAEPNALVARRQRLRWMADAVGKWQTEDKALNEMFAICQVVLLSIDLRLPDLAQSLQQRLSIPSGDSLWTNSSTKSRQSLQRSRRPRA